MKMYNRLQDYECTGAYTILYILPPYVFLGVHPYEKQDHVNARFVEETALKHTMALLGLKYSWNNMLLKKAVKLWHLCKSIYLTAMLFPK